MPVLLTKCGRYKIYAARLKTPDEVWSLQEVSFAPFAKLQN